MNPPYQSLLIKQEAENAQKEVSDAWKNFDVVQKNYKTNLISIFEKISLYSAGIISLSITYVGTLLLPDHKTVLLDPFLNFPVYYYLFLSWILFILTLISGLTVRWADSIYIFFNSQHFLHKKRKESQEKNLKMYQKYGNLHFVEGTSRDKEIEICNKNIETLGGHLIPETEKKENTYFKTYKFLQKFSIITFVLAIFLLSCFTMKTIISIIY